MAFLIILICSSNIMVSQLSFHVYDRKLVDTSSETLNLYSSNIETELRRVDKISLNTISSHELQDTLKDINDTQKSSYDKFIGIYNLYNFFSTQADLESFISSIIMVDKHGNAYTAGENPINFPEDTVKKIADAAYKRKGQILWMGPPSGDSNILAVRDIRNLSTMDDMGVLIFRIDPEALVELASNISTNQNMYLTILAQNKQIIYQNQDSKGIFNFPNIQNFNSDGIFNVNGSKYLVNHAVSAYTSWTYVYFEPYQQTFNNLLITNLISIACYLFIFFIVLFLGIKFSDSITRPIKTLSEKMKKININPQASKITGKATGDEVSQLNNSFIYMTNRINNLVKENYEKQLLLKETELKALQSQINPHFLYNTLNSITWLAKAAHQENIAVMTKSLGSLLRSTVNNKLNIIKLKDELALLQDYINIQKIRYGDRLDFRTDLQEELLTYSIPKLTLQPIVENSIKYVLEEMTQTCKIEVTSQTHSDFFLLTVQDNGPGIDPRKLNEIISGRLQSDSTGIGLKNIDERIKLFFGSEYGLIIPCNPGGGMTVTVKLPYRTE